ncbi:MAG: hypothetical protein ACREM6_17070 [Vulcanimicrobiaceae bacterium]
MNRFRRSLGAAFALAAVLATAHAASANTSIGAGVFFPNDGDSTVGVVGTLGLSSVPLLPVRPQITGAFLGGDGGRYAFTGEAEFQASKGFLGVGAGIGKMNRFGDSGLLFDLFGGFPIAPHVNVEARFYGAGGNNVGSASYLGLSLGL